MEFEKLKKIISEVLNVDPDEITMETTFQDDLGADSLDVYQIIMGIEEEFDIEIPSAIIFFNFSNSITVPSFQIFCNFNYFLQPYLPDRSAL